jgi:hypothetical protein
VPVKVGAVPLQVFVEPLLPPVAVLHEKIPVAFVSVPEKVVLLPGYASVTVNVLPVE